MLIQSWQLHRERLAHLSKTTKHRLKNKPFLQSSFIKMVPGQIRSNCHECAMHQSWKAQCTHMFCCSPTFAFGNRPSKTAWPNLWKLRVHNSKSEILISKNQGTVSIRWRISLKNTGNRTKSVSLPKLTIDPLFTHSFAEPRCKSAHLSVKDTIPYLFNKLKTKWKRHLLEYGFETYIATFSNLQYGSRRNVPHHLGSQQQVHNTLHFLVATISLVRCRHKHQYPALLWELREIIIIQWMCCVPFFLVGLLLYCGVFQNLHDIYRVAQM